MQKKEVTAGDVVVTDMGTYQHFSLVSDRRCAAGKPMLISATKRNGTVQEETWDTVVGTKVAYFVSMASNRPVAEVLRVAREQIGQWVYSVSSSNCEHFINYVKGFKVTSRQVTAGAVGALAGATAVASLVDKPNAIKILAGAAIVAGIAVYATRAGEARVHNGQM